MAYQIQSISSRRFYLVEKNPYNIWHNEHISTKFSEDEVNSSIPDKKFSTKNNSNFHQEHKANTNQSTSSTEKTEESVFENDDYDEEELSQTIPSMKSNVKPGPEEEVFVSGLGDEESELDVSKLSPIYFHPKSRISVSLKHRREQFRYEMEEKLYCSLRYQIKVQIHRLPEFAVEEASIGKLRARLVVCESENGDPRPDQQQSLDGLWDTEFRVFDKNNNKSAACDLLLHIRSKLSYHFTRRDYKLAILIYNNNCEVVAAILSPKFRLYARKPNKKQYSRIKKRKLMEQMEARKRMKNVHDYNSKNDLLDPSNPTNPTNPTNPYKPSNYIERNVRQSFKMENETENLSTLSIMIPQSIPSNAMSTIPSPMQSVTSASPSSPFVGGYSNNIAQNNQQFTTHPKIQLPQPLSNAMTQSGMPYTDHAHRNVHVGNVNSFAMYPNNTGLSIPSKSTDTFLSMEALGQLYNPTHFQNLNYNSYPQDLRHFNNQALGSSMMTSLNSASLSPETSIHNQHRMHVYPTQDHTNLDVDPMLSIYQKQIAYNYFLQQQIFCNTNGQQMIPHSNYNPSDIPPEYQSYIVPTPYNLL